MAKVISINQRDWSEYLGYVTFCYNATVHRFSPFFLMTGRKAYGTLISYFPETRKVILFLQNSCGMCVDVSDRLLLWSVKTCSDRRKQPAVGIIAKLFGMSFL